MKALPIFTLALASLWLAPAGPVLYGREPVKTLTQISALENKSVAVAKKVMPATVALVSEKLGSSGSGVIITEDGLILTAAHVIQGAEEVQVVFQDGRQTLGKVLGANYSKDIAMVKIVEKGPWPFVKQGVSKPLEAGDWVVAVGHSAGFDPGRTAPVRFGTVVSKGPGNFLTTDCKLIGGDSGGPLFDLEGNIVAIHSSIGVSAENNNHAGIDGFREDWDRLLAGDSWGKLSMNPLANPERPVLGIEMGMSRGMKGVPVVGFYPRSPAAAAGMKPGDVIRVLDGSEIRRNSDLEQLLVKRTAGDTVKIGVSRAGKDLEFEVVLGRFDELYGE
jgi:serine protease Do